MGFLSQIRFAQKLQERQAMGYYGYSNGSMAFPQRKRKTEIEKFLNSRKEPIPNCWKYYVNRISVGINRLHYQKQSNQISLNDDQIALLHDLCTKHWDKSKGKLVIPGSKNMDFYDKLTKLIPDIATFKLLYGTRKDWAYRLTTVTLKSPVNGSKWVNGRFVEQYELPLPLIYNYQQSTKSKKPKLVFPENEVEKAIYKPTKALIAPINLSTDDAWKYAKSYWAWLPSLSNNKQFEFVTKTEIKQVDNSKFWKFKKNFHS